VLIRFTQLANRMSWDENLFLFLGVLKIQPKQVYFRAYLFVALRAHIDLLYMLIENEYI
jgi:hypothetical protein